MNRRQSAVEGPPTIRLLMGYIAMLALVLILTLIQNAIHHQHGVASISPDWQIPNANDNSDESSSSSSFSSSALLTDSTLPRPAKQPEITTWPSLFDSRSSIQPEASGLRRFNPHCSSCSLLTTIELSSRSNHRVNQLIASLPETCTICNMSKSPICTDCAHHHTKSYQPLSTSQQVYDPPSHTMTTPTIAVELCCVTLIISVLTSAVSRSHSKTLCCLLCLLFAMNTVRRASVCLADYMELGASSSCALLTSQNDAVKCFGRNREGQLGQKGFYQRGDADYEMGIHLAAIDFGSGFRANFLSPSLGFHRCVISDTNETKCIGDNDKGQLGYGDDKTRGGTVDTMGDFLLPLDLGDGFVAQQVVCGGYHTCALSVLHSVKCWGNAASGQLGYGDTMQRGDGAGEMGNNLGAVDLGTGFVPIGIAAGESHTCVWSLSGTAKCFGWNYFGQLGQGDTANRGDGGGEMGDNLPTIDFGSNFFVVQICGGYVHTCALSSAGAVKCVGRNGNGQLGIESRDDIGDAAGEMGENLQAVDLGTNFIAIAIACGYEHSCALSSVRSIKCWGINTSGQLGYGDTVTRGAWGNTMGAFLNAVDVGSEFVPKEVKCGLFHTCTTSEDDQMKCWGSSSYGQLGYEDTEWRGDSSGEMGDNLSVINLLDYTFAPTTDPTAPTKTPSAAPTTAPSAAPSAAPTTPTTTPTAAPTTAPSAAPTTAPSATPTSAPSAAPTTAPSATPTTAPSAAPSAAPTTPTTAPTAAPTTAPSATPTAAPTTAPTTTPSAAPTGVPSAAPTEAPVFISTEPNASTSAPHSALIFLSAIICVLSMVFLV